MKQLVAYITSSYPDQAFTVDLALALAESGVDSLELGVPFSDPVADGPVIEKANHLSLEKGFRFNDIYTISEQITPHIDTLWMGYMNPFYQQGMDHVLDQAKALGVSGLIIPDLPFEEVQVYQNSFDARGIAPIAFVAPTDSKDRVATVVADAKKFIYLVAYAGITGASQSEALDDVVESIKSVTNTPVFVGFGVNEQTAKAKAEGVDGVIVGSALVDVLLDTSLSKTEQITTIAKKAKMIKELINS
jgi:tryptophan synthase alpha chain